jgi:ABC-type transport system involved in multi-copper enzyme maturation permease subunit
VILGLAALLFTFSSVCGEKEMGTLKLQLASALPKDTLLLGKFVGNLTGLLVPVALAFLMSFLLLLGFDAVSFAPDDAYRVLLLGLGFALYIAGLFALGMCISTFTTRTTTAFALSLVAWVLVVAILPKFAVLAARRLAPAESLQDFEMKKAAVHSQGTVEAQKMWDEYLQLHGKQMPPRAVYEEMAAQIRDRQNRELRMLDEEYMLRKERQSRLALVLARLSPAGSASYAAMSLARTGLERDLRFRSALRDYRSTFTRYYDEKSRELVQLTDAQQFPSLDVKQSFADLPAFEFHEEPLGISVERALPDLGLLVAWALVLFAAAYVKFLRYDVR